MNWSDWVEAALTLLVEVAAFLFIMALISDIISWLDVGVIQARWLMVISGIVTFFALLGCNKKTG